MRTRYLIATYVEEHWRSHGYAPTTREIATVFEITLNTVNRHLNHLANEGRLTKTPHKQCTVKPTWSKAA